MIIFKIISLQMVFIERKSTFCQYLYKQKKELIYIVYFPFWIGNLMKLERIFSISYNINGNYRLKKKKNKQTKQKNKIKSCVF